MTKNLEKADAIVKLTLALSVLGFYFTHVLNGPFANALAVLSGLMIMIFVIKLVYSRKTRTGKKP